MLFQLGRGMIVELTRRMVPDIARSLGVTLPAVASVEHSPEAPRSPDAHDTTGARQRRVSDRCRDRPPFIILDLLRCVKWERIACQPH